MTWPVDEQVIDLVYKGIYAALAGAVSDRLISGPPSAVLPREGWTPAEQYVRA